ncbi:MAG: U32 family peptidase [Oscillospiraceae bacterium]|nr:U32 family peptidase [Oscillospiraceae bacterium]
MKQIELLSPCGGYESLTAALRSGADAVYLGTKNFSARHNAVNFSADELKSAVRDCHKYGVLVYQAINTCVTDAELNSLALEIQLACEAGVDGLIIQDAAVRKTVKACCPDMPIHASTQMTLHTKNGILHAKELGFSRAVVARELPLEIISELCTLGIEIEAFVHGALCMSVSGQCYLSAMIGSRSANRGLCAGACRLPFSASFKPNDKYALSLKDMSHAEYANDLRNAGVSSLKIEGRMKRPEYVAAATDALRSSLDGKAYNTDRLRAVFSRSGFTDGYLTGKLGADMFGARVKEDVTSANDVLPELRELYRRERKKFTLDVSISASLSEGLTLTATDGENAAVFTSPDVQKAINKPTTIDSVIKQLDRLGDTVYSLGRVNAEIEDGLMIPASVLNDLRRKAVAMLDEKRIEALTKAKSFNSLAIPRPLPKPRLRKFPALRVQVNEVKQLALMGLSLAERVIIPLNEAKSYKAAGYPIEKAILSLPRFTFNEANVLEALCFAKSLGFGVIECTNTAHIKIAKDLGLEAVGGFGLNITNSLSALAHAEDGLKELTLSFELKASQLSQISSPVPTGAIVYGKLPLMLTVNCPISAEVGGCKNCTHQLIDRMGAKFPILCRKDLGYYELLNSQTMKLSNRLDDFNLDFVTLYFTTESPEEAQRVLLSYANRETPKGEYTKGLYYRGIE